MKTIIGVVSILVILGVGACTTAPKPLNRNLAKSLDNMDKMNLIRSDYAPGEITKLCDAAMEDAKARFDEIAKTPASERTFDNTVLAFESAAADLNDIAQPLTFMGYVHTDKEIHAEGSACEEKLGPFYVSIMSRKDLYDVLKEATPRSVKEKRLFSETLRDFEKAGLKLPEEKLAQVKELKQRLAVLESQFGTNLNNDTSQIVFDAGELTGVSPDFLNRLKKTPDGKFIVTAKAADYTHVMENAANGETRRRMLDLYLNRQAETNTKLLEQAIVLRQRIKDLMSYKTWADYRTDGRMAKDSETVLKFLNGLKEKLALRNRQDVAKLLKYKKELEPTATAVKAWDINYLAYQIKKRDYNLDDEKIKEYFPADRVIAGVFDIYSKLLGVKFEEVKDSRVWGTGVKLYEIKDSQAGFVVGYFYADLFPREGKYPHFAAFPLIGGRLTREGYRYPVAAMVGNFNPPSGDKPSLLKHDEVETFFHEFGHIMHQTLTRAPYASLSGTNVAQDFVEAPSQMLENWAWSPKVLALISGHYLDPAKKLPNQIVKKMIEAKDFNQGYFYTRQLMLGLLDMTYHTSVGEVDTTAVYDRLYKELVGVDPIPGGHFQAGFGHLMGGYDAGYYGYLWSEVYAQDLFTRFDVKAKRDHLLDPKVGKMYREIILERGRMVEPLELLREFLGREPNSDAFFKRLGIKS